MYVEQFENLSDVLNAFGILEKDVPGEIIYAIYGNDSSEYGMSSIIIGFDSETNQYWEVYGRHDSCCGLEGQWEVDYTTLESLRYRFHNVEQTHNWEKTFDFDCYGRGFLSMTYKALSYLFYVHLKEVL